MLDSPRTEKDDGVYVSFAGLKAGYSGMQGWRLEMEDAEIVLAGRQPKTDISSPPSRAASAPREEGAARLTAPAPVLEVKGWPFGVEDARRRQRTAVRGLSGELARLISAIIAFMLGLRFYQPFGEWVLAS